MATISNTPRPGYVWDSTDNVWYPIGVGGHSHPDYITQATAVNPTIIDAKGDIITATAADTPARLAVGANNTVLTADSSTATGLKWATPSSGLASLSGTGLNNNTTQSLSNGTNTAISFQVEQFDTDAYHSTSTNISRITIPAGKAGYYLINGSIMYASNATGQRQCNVYKNGGNVCARTVFANSGGVTQLNVAFVINLAVGDYVELYGYQDSGGSLNVVNDTPGQITTFSAVLIGA